MNPKHVPNIQRHQIHQPKNPHQTLQTFHIFHTHNFVNFQLVKHKNVQKDLYRATQVKVWNYGKWEKSRKSSKFPTLN